jgi:folate-binding Fe-S cluster repair protein YgfZ
MEHRGLARTRAIVFAAEGGINIMGGAEVTAGEQRLGFVGQGYGGHAIGFVRLDRLAEARARGEEVLAGGVRVTEIEGDRA